MVVGHDQKVLIWSRANQCRPKDGPLGQVADRRALSAAHPLNLGIKVPGLAGEVGSGEIDGLPGRHRIRRNDLHRLGELLGEAGHQVGVAGHHRLHRFAEAIPIERTGQRDGELYCVDIVAVSLRGDGVKQQPLLQRGQR